MNANALPIKSAVARFAVFQLKHVLVAIEPSFSSHDVWSMSKARRQYEWEVKQSMDDLRREAHKWKHERGEMAAGGNTLAAAYHHFPNYFYIVVPKAIADKADAWVSENLPYAGFAVADPLAGQMEVNVVRQAQLLHKRRADLKRCSRVARWMAVSVVDLLEERTKVKEST